MLKGIPVLQNIKPLITHFQKAYFPQTRAEACREGGGGQIMFSVIYVISKELGAL